MIHRGVLLSTKGPLTWPRDERRHGDESTTPNFRTQRVLRELDGRPVKGILIQLLRTETPGPLSRIFPVLTANLRKQSRVLIRSYECKRTERSPSPVLRLSSSAEYNREYNRSSGESQLAVRSSLHFALSFIRNQTTALPTDS